MKTLFTGCSKICFTPLFPSRDSYKNRLWRESGAPLRGMEAVGPWTLSMTFWHNCHPSTLCLPFLQPVDAGYEARPLCVFPAALSLCLVSHQDCQLWGHHWDPILISEILFLAGSSASAFVCLLASFSHPPIIHSFNKYSSKSTLCQNLLSVMTILSQNLCSRRERNNNTKAE